MKRPKSTDKIYDLIMQTADSIITEANPNQVLIENKSVLIYCHKTPGGKLYVRQNDSKR